MLHLFSILLLIVVFLLLSACKKEKDKLPPQISIIMPMENSTYSVQDLIPVKATIHDNEVVESIEVSLYSQNDNRKVGKTVSVRVGASSYDLDINYRIDDSLLTSGAYYIRIHAYDGNNIGYAFKNIHVNGLAKKRLKVLLLSSSGNSTSIFELSENTLESHGNFNFQYAGAGLNSLEKVLFLTDGSANKIVGLDATDYSIKWNKEFLAPSSTSVINYVSMNANKDNVAVSVQNGYTELLSYKGHIEKIYYTETGMFPHRHFVLEDLAFLESYSNSMNTHKIEVFYSNTSGNFDNKNIDFEIVGIFRNEKDNYDFFVNRNGKSWLLEYSVAGKIITTKDDLVNDSITEVLKITGNEFVLSSGSKIYKYRKSSGSTLNYINGKKAGAMAYDPLMKELFISVANQLFVYDYSSGNQKANFPVSGEIKEIFPVYNY